MTMPHLMNCLHDDKGWCIACVKTLYNRNMELEKFLDVGVHTQKCWDYAVRTTSRGVGAHCIAECADLRRAMIGGRTNG